MLYYYQTRPDGAEAWQAVDEKELDKLDATPAFMSVLKVNTDPNQFIDAEEDPLDHCEYKGPMYFDLDNADDIDQVLDSSRELLEKLENDLNIDRRYIHCWLSGGKGVHITVPEALFGLKRQTKALPIIYKEIAKELQVEDLDMSVYSAGMGRMWRCENVKRPNKKYKVGVSVEELEMMDADTYEVLVASNRPPIAREYPKGENVVSIRAEQLFRKAKASARKILKARKNAKVVPVEDLRKLDATPGCVQKLITQGDCPDSNWNQAAMQLAAYIASRYERKDSDTYREELITPFVENVHSSSRPTAKERRKHIEGQLGRAFTGRTKFAVGPLIAALGEPCGECPLCRGDLTFDQPEADDEEEPYDPRSKIKATFAGYALVGDNGVRPLTTFTFWPHTIFYELEEDEFEGGYKESARRAMTGTLIDEEGNKSYNFTMPESAWGSKAAMIKAVSGMTQCSVQCTDVELQKIYVAVIKFMQKGAVEEVTRTKVCGVYFEQQQKNRITPHYIEAGNSVTQGNMQSRFRFRGANNLSPSLIAEDYPYKNDHELQETLSSVMRINEDHNVAMMLGWFVACHLREHIHSHIPQFPLLNVWGNASAGKTMSVMLLSHLNGMDYQMNAEPLNMENSTLYPLIQYVTSSTTVPRLVEEVNESLMNHRVYSGVVALFKAAWNRSTVPRGNVNRITNTTEVENHRVSSPIVYVSEQRTSLPPLRNRTIEVLLTSQGRESRERMDHFNRAYRGRHSLFRLAKTMVHEALQTHPKEIAELVDANQELVPDKMDPRPKFSYQVVMTGLDFLARCMKAAQLEDIERVEELKQALSSHLAANFDTIDSGKRTSVVDQLLQTLDDMVGSPDGANYLVEGDTYYRIGSVLALDTRQCMAAYRRYCKGMEKPVIRDASQFRSLLEGEPYFERKEMHDTRDNVTMHVINLHRLSKRGVSLTNFKESAMAG